jgi:hypothetical protein
LRRADPLSKESYRLCKKDYETGEEARAQQRPAEPLTNEMNEMDVSILLNIHDSALSCMVSVCISLFDGPISVFFSKAM